MQQKRKNKIVMLNSFQHLHRLFPTRGFTLIELLVVVLIIGILAAVAVPQYQKAIAKSQTAQLQTLLTSIAKAGEVFYLQMGTAPSSLDKLDLNIGLELTEGYRAVCTIDLVPSSVYKGENFEISLLTYPNAFKIGAFFTKGRYKCTGFIYFIDNNLRSATEHGANIDTYVNHKLFCAENRYKRDCGQNCNWGDFCKKLMGKQRSPIQQDGTTQLYLYE